MFFSTLYKYEIMLAFLLKNSIHGCIFVCVCIYIYLTVFVYVAHQGRL